MNEQTQAQTEVEKAEKLYRDAVVRNGGRYGRGVMVEYQALQDAINRLRHAQNKQTEPEAQP